MRLDEVAAMLIETSKCTQCNGAGQVFPGPNTCPNCNGSGEEPTPPLPPIDDIKSAYIGKDGACCCGCSGTHYYAKAHQARASQSRGYPVGDDEINDAMISKAYDVIYQAILDKDPGLDYGPNYIAVPRGKKIYILYTD